MMYKTSIFFAVVLSACSQNSHIIDDRVLMVTPLYDTLLNFKTNLMAVAMTSDAEIRPLISQETVPALVFLVSEEGLNPYLTSKNLTKDQFRASSGFQQFLKSHIMTQNFIGSGDYTSAGGSTWIIESNSRLEPAFVNKIAVRNCYSIGFSEKARQKGLLCVVDKPIADL